MRSPRHVGFQVLVAILAGITGCGGGAAGPAGGTAGSSSAGSSSVAGTTGTGGATATGGGTGAAGTSTAGTTGSAGSSGAAGTTALGGAGAAAEGDAPGSPVSYTPSTEIILNPERGFFRTANLATVRDLDDVRADGKTLVYAAVHLDDYLGANHAQDLPQQLLDDVQDGFAAVREAGLKAAVRFQYDDGEGYPGGADDATEAWMLKHIQQLGPVLKSNEDVLFVLYAGFIGAWGEWHTSNNFVDGPAGEAPRKRIVDALLLAAPTTRRVMLRYPAYKRMFFGEPATSDAQLLAGADVSRAGHHNDCFVSSADDVGTYQYEPVDVLKDYLAEDTRNVPIGGETCAVHASNSCETTTAEMERFHWTFINDEYHPEVLARWQDEGCRPDIERKLGYRIALKSGSLPTAVRPGGSFTLDLTLANEGWAALTNARPVFIVLDGQGQRLTAELPVDARTWQPGPIQIHVRLRLPSDLAPGAYELALWLPDAATELRGRPEYSVQLANQGAWNATRGDNTLGELAISDAAAGDVDAAAATFTVIP